MGNLKDITEAALNYDKGAIFDNNISAFVAGVEFAQRWIPVEEELPGKIDDGGFSEQVLVKSHGNTYQVKRYDHELHRWTGDIYFIPVAWRPIEHK